MKWKLLNWPLDPGSSELWTEFLDAAQMPTQYGSAHFFTDPFVRGGERFAIAAMDAQQKIAALATGVQQSGIVTCGLPSRPQVFFRNDVDRQDAMHCLFEGIVKTWDQNSSKWHVGEIVWRAALSAWMERFGLSSYNLGLS
ncbi:MAG: hypothetical protein R2682_14810 [Pyrinomonadaceae bacterium]